MRSDGRLDRVAHFLKVLRIGINLLTYRNEPLNDLHPLPGNGIVKHMRHLGPIALNGETEHSHPHRPGRNSNGKGQVLVVGLNILPHQTAVNNVVHGTDHVPVPRPLSQHENKTAYLLPRLLVPLPVLMVLLPQFL
jgi:hypothetical protein